MGDMHDLMSSYRIELVSPQLSIIYRHSPQNGVPRATMPHNWLGKAGPHTEIKKHWPPSVTHLSLRSPKLPQR
jgi:hypothetical protein